MLLERISLENFRAFRGRHEIDLTPESPQRPIVLVTGQNGAGKTTLLEALYLVLYGKRTPSPRRSGQAYERYLDECRHQRCEDSEEAAVGLRLSQFVEGEPITLELRRSWSSNGAGTRERFVVRANSIEDTLLRDEWGQYIEELLPSRLAPLFFFDGEKIESLADLEATTEVLSVALHSLLGIDLVDQLYNDLEVLERKRGSAAADCNVAQQLEDLDRKCIAAQREEHQAFQERASVQSQLDRARAVVRRKERDFEARGGVAFEQRTELEAQLRDAEREVRESRRRLRELAAGYAPLLLLPELLRQVCEQAVAEQKADESRLLTKILAERDRALLRKLEDMAPADSLHDVAAWLEQDRHGRDCAGSIEPILGMSSAGASQLERLLDSGLPRVQTQVDDQLAEHRSRLRALETARKRLAGIPEEGTLREVRHERDTAQKEVGRLEGQLAAREEAYEAAQRRASEEEQRLKSAHLDSLKSQTAQADTRRLTDQSQRVRSTLESFREKMLRRHIERIEELILEGLHRLLHKERLVTDIRISPEDFSVVLRGRDDRPLAPELLSAGERQLLAIAILWGLARAARRPMPTLIDTPLGRLDSSHRKHLVERYFPFASHQVLLLSTDEEISGVLLQRLLPQISHSYFLEYDDATASTTIEAPDLSTTMVASS